MFAHVRLLGEEGLTTCIGRDLFIKMKRKRRLDKPGGTKVRVHWLRLLEVFHAEKDAKSAAKAAAKAEAEGKQRAGMRLGDGLQADVMHILNNLKGTGIWKMDCQTQTPSLDTSAAVGTASAGAASHEVSLLAARGRGRELPLLTTPLRNAFKVGMAPKRFVGPIPYY